MTITYHEMQDSGQFSEVVDAGLSVTFSQKLFNQDIIKPVTEVMLYIDTTGVTGNTVIQFASALKGVLAGKSFKDAQLVDGIATARPIQISDQDMLRIPYPLASNELTAVITVTIDAGTLELWTTPNKLGFQGV